MTKKNRLLNILFLVTLIIFGFETSISAKVVNTVKNIEIANEKTSEVAEFVSDMDSYQNRYFEIIKRNNIFLNYENDAALNKDRKELKKLYKQVEKKITNKQYLKKYKSIEKRYAKCNEITTIGINEFAKNYYNEVDSLLNEVYKVLKTKISHEDFKKIYTSEKNWLKEVDDYKNVYDSMEYGTIGTSIYLDYQTDMRKFRTLLLMLYL